MRKTLRRRDVVTWLGVGALAVPVLGSSAVLAAPPDEVASPGPQPHAGASSEALPFRSLEPGMSLYGVWEVEAVHGPIAGAVAVHLRDKKELSHRFRLNVLKRDDSGLPGVGQSRSLSVYVCNNGGPTQEREGQAARALAAWLEHYERTGLPVPSLVTLRQHSIAQL